MDEVDRFKADLADEKARADEAEGKASAAEQRLEFYQAMAGSDHRLRDSDDTDYIQRLATKRVEDGESWEDAMAAIAEAKPHLFVSPAADGGAPSERKPGRKATTQPPRKRTEQPAEKQPEKTKSDLELSPEEFRKAMEERGTPIPY